MIAESRPAIGPKPDLERRPLLRWVIVMLGIAAVAGYVYLEWGDYFKPRSRSDDTVRTEKARRASSTDLNIPESLPERKAVPVQNGDPYAAVTAGRLRSNTSESEPADTDLARTDRGGSQSFDREKYRQRRDGTIGKPGHSVAVYTKEANKVRGVDWKLLDGLYPAALETRIDTTTEGLVIARFNETIWCSRGQNVCLPKHTEFHGILERDINLSTQRAAVTWQRLLFPDGRVCNFVGEFALDDALAAGPLGAGGIGSKLETFFGPRVRDAAILSILGAGVSLSGDSRSGTNAGEQLRIDIADDLRSEARVSIQQNQRSYVPVLRRDIGAPIRIWLRSDLDFYKYYHENGESCDG